MENTALLNNLKKQANDRFDFAINQPQAFARVWQKTENALNSDFDNDRFNKYKAAILRQAVKKFYSEPFPLRQTALSIHVWQIRWLDVAIRRSRA